MVSYRDTGQPVWKALNIQSGNGQHLDAEAALIVQAQENPEAFGTLYEHHYRSILNFIYRSVADVTLAEELTSNTFLSALRGLPKYKPNAPFRSWLYRIALNEIRMFYRSKQRRQRIEDAYSNMDALHRVHYSKPEMLIDEERQEQIKKHRLVLKTLSQLPPQYREILTLRYLEKMSHQDIADLLGKSVGAVKQLIHRGIKKTRSILEKKSNHLDPSAI